MINILDLIKRAADAGVFLFVETDQLRFRLAVETFPADIKQEILAHKADIIAFLSARKDSIQPLAHGKIEKTDRENQPGVLSFAQQRLWLIDQVSNGSAVYNIPVALKVKGKFDLPAAELAISRIIQRHEPLRTVFAVEQDLPVQIISEEFDFTIEQQDLTALDEQEQQEKVNQLIEEDASHSFDLARDLMVRASYLRLSEQGEQQQGILLFTMHHIASDGWSIGVIVKEFIAQYQAAEKGEADPIDPLAIQYLDYAHWQKQWLTGEVLDNQLDYWKKQLADLPVTHSLTLDQPRPQVKKNAAAEVIGQLPVAISKSLQSLAAKYQLTDFMLLHAALALVLSRHSHSHDIVMATPVANRLQAELEPLIGFFVNTLVLRLDTKHEQLANYLAHVRQVHLQAQSNQDVPFEQLVEHLNVSRSTAHTPLFQIMLTTNTDYGVSGQKETESVDLPEASLSLLRSQTMMAKFDLDIDISFNDSGLATSWTYDKAIFSQGHIEQFNDHLCRVLTALAGLEQDDSTSVSSLSNLPMLSGHELDYLIDTLNDTDKQYEKDKCIHELFEHQVAVNPDKTALVFAGEAMTYRQLNEQANQLAHYLVEQQHIKPDTLVGLCTERSFEMVIGILAIVKSGGAYLPLEPSLPKARMDYILEDAGLGLILSHQAVEDKVAFEHCTTVMIDDNCYGKCSSSNLDKAGLGLTSSHLAYVIYTSGSTGNPKGVLVEHQALHNRIDWMEDEYKAGSEDRILQKTPFTFDVSVWEFFWPLTSGAQLIIAKPQGHKDSLYLLELIQEQQISKLHFVPSMLAAMLELDQFSHCTSLKQVFCSGEVLALSHVEKFKRLLPSSQLHNLYGPTEAAIDVTYWDCSNNAGLSVPIGKAIQNIQLLVLDEQLNVAAQRVTGELYIGGDGLARGYLNKPELTAERFVANPYYDVNKVNNSKLLYKTGDLVRYLPDGNLVFIGRSDDQVKIRGFRIELGEIEYQLNQCQGLESSLVLAKNLENDNKQLVAYIQPTQKAQAEEVQDKWLTQVKQTLAKVLPEYMVPGIFMFVQAWPLTANGKIDKKALPEPDGGLSRIAYIAPENETEKALVQIWADLLSLKGDSISTRANFFELGGHSLLIVQMVARAEKMAISLSAQQVFAQPVLADLAALIVANESQEVVRYQAPENFIPENCQQVTPQMLPLVDLKQAEIDAIADQVPAGVENIQDIYPLAPLQAGILFHHMMSKESDPYVLPMLFALPDEQAFNRFSDSLQFIVNRHDVLRTAVLWQGLPEPVQVVYRQAQLSVQWLAPDETQDIELQMRSLMAPHKQWMDICEGPLLKLQVARAGESGKCYVLLQLHHIISDHVGLDIIQQEVLMHQGGQMQALAKAMPYREFVAHALHQAKQHDAQAFFIEMLAQVDTATAPFDLTNIQGDGSAIVEQTERVPDAISGKIRLVAKQLKCSPAVLFHSAWAMVLAACSNRHDVVFGSVFSGRLQGTQGAENMMGMFINTLPLRIDLQGHNVRSFIRQMQSSLQALIPFEQASLALAQQCSALPSDTPLFSAILNYRLSGSYQRHAEAIEQQTGIQTLDLQERTNYPFSLSVDDFGDGFSLDVQVDASVDVGRIVAYVQTAIAALAQNLIDRPEFPLAQLSVLPPQELSLQLAQGNTRPENLLTDLCIHELFEQQVIENPESIALVFEQESLTYRQLNEQANQFAHYLIDQHKISPDSLVGLCIEPSLDMVVAILGILKSGGAYVPLDVNSPKSRFDYILKDAELDIVVTQKAPAVQLGLSEERAIIFERQAFEQYPTENITKQTLGLSASNLAYVIYTSGSTGHPKGVLIEHRNVQRLFSASQSHFSFDGNDVWLLFHSFAFDFSVWEIWGALFHGGRLVVAPRETLRSTDELLSLVQREKVTVLNQTPSAFNQFSSLVLNQETSLDLRYVIFGGEALNLASLSPWLEQFGDKTPQLVNMYGITETTVHVTFKRILKAEISQTGDASLIGRPLADLSALVLSPLQALLPVGVVGELYVGGAGIARSYLNKQELTAERFIDNPYFDPEHRNSSKRLYKTGDLVRYLADGSLEFIGRVDDQVKIRGFRIELGEIEYQLNLCEQVDSCLVMAKQSPAGSAQLVAYLKLSGTDLSDTPWFDAVKQQLKAVLPAYMVPSAFILVDEWSLTANGKIDKKLLPEMDGMLLQGEFVAPESETEKTLAGIWAKLLKLDADNVSVNANFFELGGHSLSTIRLVSEIRQQLQQELSVKTIFECPTIKTLARQLASTAAVSLRQEVKALSWDNKEIPLSFAQQRLWFIDQLQNGSPEYNMPVAYHIEGAFELDTATRALTQIIERHQVLRTRYKADKSGAVQQVQQSFNFEISNIDLTTLSEREQDQKLQAFISDDAQKPFDLNQELMVRASFILLDKGDLAASVQKGVLLFNMHHIASDGWSLEVLLHEFSVLYQAIRQGLADGLPPLDIQYADYAHWQRTWLQDEVLDLQLGYWQQQLADVPPVHSLLLDKPRPEIKKHDGAMVLGQLSAEVAEALKALAHRYQMTPFMLLHGALALVLSRHSNTHDIVIATPVANRLQAELEPLIGFFVNTLVLRLDTCHQQLDEYFAQIRQVHLQAQSNQDVPFEQLVERLNIPRSTAHTPLFQIMLNTNTGFQFSGRETQDALSFSGADLTPLQPDFVAAKFDLDIDISLDEKGVSTCWTYDKALFTREHVEQLNEHLSCLLAELAKVGQDKAGQEKVTLDSLNMLPAAETSYLLDGLNETRASYPDDKCIHELFEQQVAVNPDKLAFVYGQSQLTYRQLNNKANQLARYLVQELQVKPDMVVGICVERSLEMAIGIVAILKAGAAYVPLDPGNPQARLNYMFADTKAKVLLTQSALKPKLAEFSGQAVYLDGLAQSDNGEDTLYSQYSTDNLCPRSLGLGATNLAYVIYTSGSTGNPKGVMIEHQGCVNHSNAMIRALSLSESDTIAQTAPMSFDISVWQTLTLLIVGGKTVIVSDDEVKNPRALLDKVEEHHISVLQIVPSLMEVMLEMDTAQQQTLSSLKWLLVTGEAFPPNLYRRWTEKYPNTSLMNAYGPAECSDDVSLYAMEAPNKAHPENIFLETESEVRYYCRNYNTVFDQARGSLMFDIDGRQHIDFLSGAGSLNYGHNNAVLKEALLSYIENDGITHSLDMYTKAKGDFLQVFDDAILKPRNLNYKVMFPGPTGTNAVEAALKLARKVTGRKTILHGENSFHGMTLGALSVTGGQSYKKRAGIPLDYTDSIEFVTDKEHKVRALQALAEKVDAMDEMPAAIILETTQAEGGLNVADVGWLTELFAFARARNILMIVDDIQVGCGRTGKFFSFEHYGLTPDLVCLSKSISGYGMPMALLLIKPEFDIWQAAEHNGTFRGNNLAFITAAQTIKSYWTKSDFAAQVQQKIQLVEQGLEQIIKKYPVLNGKRRGIGLIQGIEYSPTSLGKPIQMLAFDAGLIIETAGRQDEVIKLLPALTTPIEVLQQGLAILDKAIDGAIKGLEYTAKSELVSEALADRTSIPIGKPIDNIKIYILDANQQLTPQEAIGELCVSGIGLARGYLNQAQLTEEKFIELSLQGKTERVYKTGDLARWLPDGNLEYLGRIDNQVKIRGLRIELGEIEYQIEAQPEVDSSLVLAVSNDEGDKKIVAYVKLASEQVEFASDNQVCAAFTRLMKARLNDFLPGYMLPSAFVLMSQWPLTPNGKIDRKALLALDINLVADEYLAPENDTEQALAEVWSELLSIDQANISASANFFELGGHSLLVIGAIEKLRSKNIHLDVNMFFEAPVLRQLANLVVENKQRPVLVDVPDNLISAQTTKITPQLLPLIDLQQQDIDRVIKDVAGGVENVQDIYPLLPLQQGMLFHHQLNAEQDVYQELWLLSFPQSQAVQLFVETLQQVIDRHDILRTSFHWQGLPAPVQLVERKATLSVETLELVDNGDTEQALRAELEQAKYAFDLTKAPLLKAYITKDSAQNRWLLALPAHHLVCDHVTIELIFEEVHALMAGKGADLPISYPFRNFVAQAMTTSEQEYQAYFSERLQDITEPTAPFDILDIQGDGQEITVVDVPLPESLSRRVRACAGKHGVSSAVIFHVAWAQVLAGCTGKQDVVFGTVLSGRMQGSSGIDRAMGMFINTLPVRFNTAALTVTQAVQQSYQDLATILRYEQAPLVLAQQCSAVPASMPLFTSLLNYRHNQAEESSIEEADILAGVDIISAEERSNYPLSLSVDDFVQGISLQVQSVAAISGERVGAYVVTVLEHLLQALESQPQQLLSELDILPKHERTLVLKSFNDTEVDYPKNTLIHQIIERQSQSTPDAVAVDYLGEQLTFAQLNERANQFAHLLVGQGVQPDSRVALCMDRGLDMVVAMLAILKSGGAYVPLDPSYPLERLTYMLQDSAPVVLLTQVMIQEQIGHSNLDIPLLVVDSAEFNQQLRQQGQQSANLKVSGLTAEHLAYVIYTSGSTGKPKGVMVEHHNICNLVTAQGALFNVHATSKVMQFASIAFDAASFEIFMALANGAALYLAPAAQLAPGVPLVEFMKTQAITHATLPGSVLSACEFDDALALEELIVAGDVCPVPVASQWGAKYRFFNAYGPTESTVWASAYQFEKLINNAVSIGRPITNTQIYILDPQGQPVPVGREGELYIGGAGVARGYLNREDLTQERFLADPFSGDPKARMYRTGDMGRWHGDGYIDYLGRNDFQVKLRGYRIELGEIENQLLNCNGVREAFVMAREQGDGEKSLVGYLVINQGQQLDVAEIRKQLMSVLPEYMLPGALVALDSFPLTTNGKIDRRALPAPDMAQMASREYQAPQGDIESVLALAWQELLELKQVGRLDNFFELGGHSLHLARLVNVIRAELMVEMPLQALFENPTLETLAQRVSQIQYETFMGEDKADLEDELAGMSEEELLMMLAQDDD